MARGRIKSDYRVQGMDWMVGEWIGKMGFGVTVGSSVRFQQCQGTGWVRGLAAFNWEGEWS